MEKPLGKTQRRDSKSGLLLGIAGPNPAHGATRFFYIAEDKDFAKLVKKKGNTPGVLKKFDDNGGMHITLPKAPISSAITTTNAQGNHVGETLFPFPASGPAQAAASAAQKRKE